MLHVTVKSVTVNEATGHEDVVLECDGTQVKCEDMTWFDGVNDNDELLFLFEEWRELAKAGEEGYTIL